MKICGRCGRMRIPERCLGCNPRILGAPKGVTISLELRTFAPVDAPKPSRRTKTHAMPAMLQHWGPGRRGPEPRVPAHTLLEGKARAEFRAELQKNFDACGLTRGRFARMIGIGASTLTGWLSGQSAPPRERAASVLKRLGVGQ